MSSTNNWCMVYGSRHDFREYSPEHLRSIGETLPDSDEGKVSTISTPSLSHTYITSSSERIIYRGDPTLRSSQTEVTGPRVDDGGVRLRSL